MPWPWLASSGDPVVAGLVLGSLAIAAMNAGDYHGALRLARQVEQIPADIPGWMTRGRSNLEAALVTLVAQGRTDAQIAAQLSVSVREVSSRLDHIRDKTGCRRRADLISLALQAGLV